jgi:hypothetical protein
MRLNRDKKAGNRTAQEGSTPIAEKREAVATPPPAIFSLEEYPRREEGSARANHSTRSTVAYHEGVSRLNYDLFVCCQLVR